VARRNLKLRKQAYGCVITKLDSITYSASTSPSTNITVYGMSPQECRERMKEVIEFTEEQNARLKRSYQST
jgi:predicted RNase H-like HicB family nuclease